MTDHLTPSQDPSNAGDAARTGPDLERVGTELGEAVGHVAGTMPLSDHLEELRRRVILALLGLLPIVVAALILGKPLLAFLLRPVQEALIDSGASPLLQATGPLETFGTYLRVALVTAILLGSPWLLYQLWRFIAPGLYASERRFVHVLLPLSTVLTASGIAFLYGVILPVVLAFFITFGTGVSTRTAETAPPPPDAVFPTIPVLDADPDAPSLGEEWVNTALMQRRVCVGFDGEDPIVMGTDLVRASGIAQQYRVSEYVKLFLSLALAFALGFQTPVVVLLLGWAGLVERAWLARSRRYALLIACVGSAILTPADPISMLLLAGPLYLLFELGMLLMILLPAERVARGFRPQVKRDERAVSSSRDPFAREPDGEPEDDPDAMHDQGQGR
ncbi:MAG: twin-arginine translocase subunit TatC [Planctomycetota bacterium]